LPPSSCELSVRIITGHNGQGVFVLRLSGGRCINSN
jgi:hypothetical protein